MQRFIQSQALEGVKVIVRWRPEDIRSGVSDIEIYPYLAQLGIPLYVNFAIHLKLYVFESNVAFSTSGNLTLRGFGYSEKQNVEVGSFVRLGTEDWSQIYALINASRQVDADTYQRYKRFLEACPPVVEPTATPPFLLGDSKLYTISTLPATETPDALFDYYFTATTVEHSADEMRRAAHDFAIFKILPGLNRTELNQQLNDSFRDTPFVAEFVELLKNRKSLRFGAVNDWIHRTCEDVPLPYRWEVKENTRIFYNWLEHFFRQITWDRPNHSQVIYWRD